MLSITEEKFKKLEFELIEDYSDKEISYKDFKFKDITVCLEPEKNIVELNIENVHFEIKGVKTPNQLEKFIELVYGEE